MKIKEWCEDNGLTFLQTLPFFTLGTDELDPNCFYQSPAYNLNRTGAIRLLDAISKDCPHLVCENWDQVKSNWNLHLAKEREFLHTNYYYNQQQQSSDFTQWEQTNDGESNDQPSWAGMVRGEGRRQPVRRDEDDHRQGYNPSRGAYKYPNTRASYESNNMTKKVGCYNCGEFNHHINRCRYDHDVTCRYCNKKGHKSKLCYYYSA